MSASPKRLGLAVVLALALLGVNTVSAQPVCTCEDTNDTVCVQGPSGNGSQAFEVTLLSFQVDQENGTSEWIYEVCDLGPLDPDCPSDKALSHIDIALGDLSACLDPDNEVTFEKIADSAGDGADLTCGVHPSDDPSCDLDGDGDPRDDDEGLVGKCDVEESNPLDPGDCVQVRLAIAGETAVLGGGVSLTQSKAGPECAADCILGPSCEPCGGGSNEDACLTRTAGFWGTHPHITELFLPVQVCGTTLRQTDAGRCDSTSEALCVAPGKESKKNRAYAQLVRQLTAAKLNVEASLANGGSCTAGDIELRILECEALCDSSHKDIAKSGCIEDLEAFNESQDTIPTTPAPFDRPGPAQPGECQEANGNGRVIGGDGCQE